MMPRLTTDIQVLCPKDNRKVDTKIECEGPPRCTHFKHFMFQSTRVYVICSFGAAAKKEEPVQDHDPADPEWEEVIKEEEEREE